MGWATNPVGNESSRYIYHGQQPSAFATEGESLGSFAQTGLNEGSIVPSGPYPRPSQNGHGGISPYAEPYVQEPFREQLGTQDTPGATSLERMSSSQQMGFLHGFPYRQSQQVSAPQTGQQNLFPETTFANFDTWLRGEKEKLTASGKEAGYNPYEGEMTQLPSTFTGIKPGQWTYQGGNVVRETNRPGNQMLLPQADIENKQGWSTLARQMQESGPLDGKGHGGTSEAEEMDETASEGGVAVDGGKGDDAIRIYVTHDDIKSHNGETHGDGGPPGLVGSAGLAEVFHEYNKQVNKPYDYEHAGIKQYVQPAHNPPIKQFFPEQSSQPSPAMQHIQWANQMHQAGMLASLPRTEFAKLYHSYYDLTPQEKQSISPDIVRAIHYGIDSRGHGDGIGSPQNIGSDGPGNVSGGLSSLG